MRQVTHLSALRRVYINVFVELFTVVPIIKSARCLAKVEGNAKMFAQIKFIRYREGITKFNSYSLKRIL